MLDVVLKCALQSVVRVVTFLQLEVNQYAVVVIERKQVIFCLLIVLELFLKLRRITSINKVGAAAVITMTIMRHELLNINAMLLRDNVFLVVDLVAICASNLAFFNLDQDFGRQINMNKCIEPSFVVFQLKHSLNIVQHESFLVRWL